YEYTFNAVDPDGDNVKYHIDWDDGDSEETGFNPSGTNVKVKHTWSEEGTYTIKVRAKDTNDLIGLWGTLTVTMPRNRATQRPFLSFLQQHLNLFPILQMLLQRLGLQ
ncbi:MAG: PKD domain-containing protein, partial [Thermoplasmatales archaeon]|nr:PKD domain-containing protein [Thermoplasmatales archaeon]